MLQRYRDKWPWFDHIVSAALRYQDKKGDYFGAGITYFSVFALFPLMMVAFAIGGYVLINDADLLAEIKDQINSVISDDSLRKSVSDLVDQAIASRGTVGIVGLAGGLWAGLGWMANVRAGLTEMWDSEVPEQNFVMTKVADLGALAGLFVAIVACTALMAAGSSPLTGKLLDAAGLGHAPGLHFVITCATLVVTLLAMWVLWTFVIARLPRVQFPWRNAARAGLMTAIAFMILVQLATVLLGATMRSPAGATFGPILGIMLFIYFTARIVLFATAWAATDPRNQRYVIPAAPEPVVISPVVRSEPDAGRTALAGAAGLVAGLGLGSLLRRKR
ncbi:inner membrane protein YhjD [Tsukamurella asaccharolytica]|uniref:Inner membrane protein YhjD n=1 Tax=Tsukamurella asaccharolytica TaxID=2592067 RepID=A0A5C5RAV1_9ACTN|nr:YhjD/YihY/BrkB family envelope integrity protein [Tsukamurella asaccharolytica]TWS19231.1 inner membrane protein YhjD [Tsukamurella asaccharolytica]